MSFNPHIVEAEQLRKLSGKRTAASVRKWASSRGIPVHDGKEGPWTTIEAVNRSLGVGSSANDPAYSPEDIA